jgi:hypothetical protein
VSRVCPDGEDESILSEIERDQVPPQVGPIQDSGMASKGMNDGLSQMLEGATGGDSTMLLNQALIEALLKEAADSADETDDVLQRDNRRSGQLDTNEIPSMPVSEVHSTKSIDSLSLPELKVPNCGNGFIQRGEDCGEPGLTCPAGLLCNEKTCRCGTCMACQRCGEGVFSQCDRDSCIALGPCAYERDPEDKEGTCSPHPVLCEDIPDACLTCTQCGIGILNICDRDECEEGWGRGVYCTFTKGMPFVNVGDCKPKQSLCSGS